MAVRKSIKGNGIRLALLTRLAFGSSTRATFPNALSRRPPPPPPPLWELPLSLPLSSPPRNKPLRSILNAGSAHRTATAACSNAFSRLDKRAVLDHQIWCNWACRQGGKQN